MLLLPGSIIDDDLNFDSVKAIKNYPDLPESIVHQILQQAKKQGLQTYALIYVLFGAGLSLSEIVELDLPHHLSSKDRQTLQINDGLVRQVPINQWIMGKRYGSYLKNPLTQWLNSRKDHHNPLFINIDGSRITETELRQQWQQLTIDFITPTGGLPSIEQTQSTWCVEMLMRGITIDGMQLITGWKASQLEYYIHRAKEKAAVLEAINLDK